MKRCIQIILFCFTLLTFAGASANQKTNNNSFIDEQIRIESNFSNLPASLQEIGDEAFEGTAIVKIEVPETVAIIGDKAFANISTLSTIRIPATTKSIALTAFDGSNNVTINAAPNSYARKFAKAAGIPFAPIATFCALNTGTISISNTDNHPHEAIETDSILVQKPEQRWRKREDIKTAGTLELILNDIQSRGPPTREC